VRATVDHRSAVLRLAEESRAYCAAPPLFLRRESEDAAAQPGRRALHVDFESANPLARAFWRRQLHGPCPAPIIGPWHEQASSRRRCAMLAGIGSYTYPWAIGVPGYEPEQPLGVVALLERATALGVGVVQVCDNLPLDAMDEPLLARVQERAAHLGLRLEVGTRGIEPFRLERYLELARRLGSPLVRTVTDRGEHRPSADEVVHTLRPVLPRFADSGVVLAIENHDRFTAAQLVGILARLDSPAVGICLDTVNSFGALEAPAVVVQALAPYTVCLHVKDFVVSRHASQLGFTICGAPAGQGRLDLPAILDRLGAAGRCASAIIELWTPFGPGLPQTLSREEEWAVQSAAYLTGLLGGGQVGSMPT
jgi:sugar phosphate isomerase/epimerase